MSENSQNDEKLKKLEIENLKFKQKITKMSQNFEFMQKENNELREKVRKN